MYNWLENNYCRKLGDKFPGIHFIGPVTFEDAASTSIAPGCVIGHPSKEFLMKLSTLDEEGRNEILEARTPVKISRNVTIGPFSTIYEGVQIEKNVFLEGRCMIRSFSSIHKDSNIYFGSYVGENVSIGNDCKIGGFVCNNSEIGEGSAIFGSLVHKYPRPGMKEREPSPIIGKNVLVGMGSLIIGAVHIGSNAKVAAGSIVLKDIPESKIVKGIYK